MDPPLADLSTNRQRLSRCSILREKIEDPIYNPLLPPTTLLSSTYDTEISFKIIEPRHSYGRKEKGDKEAYCSIDNIIPYSLRSPIASPNPELPLVSWRSPLREDAVGSMVDPAGSAWMWSPTSPTDVVPATAMDATGIRRSSKRTADSADLNESGEDVQRLEKTRRADQYAVISSRGCVIITLQSRDRNRQDR